MEQSRVMEASRCPSCDTLFFPPRDFCATCWDNPATALEPLSGKGTLYSVTNVHIGRIAPCSVGYVDLDEGVRVLARFEMLDDPSAYIGADRRVRVGYGPDGGDSENSIIGEFDT